MNARLLNTLLDEAADDEQREQAALALGALGDAALPRLRALLQSDEVDHRWWVARALTAVGGAPAASLLIETLSDSDPDVRACAAMGLGLLAAPEAVGPLIRVLVDESAYVARIASDALSQVGALAIPALIEALSSASTATRLGAARALVPLESHAAIPALCKALDDDSALVTHFAEEALERMGVGIVLIKP